MGGGVFFLAVEIQHTRMESTFFSHFKMSINEKGFSVRSYNFLLQCTRSFFFSTTKAFDFHFLIIPYDFSSWKFVEGQVLLLLKFITYRKFDVY